MLCAFRGPMMAATAASLSRWSVLRRERVCVQKFGWCHVGVLCGWDCEMGVVWVYIEGGGGVGAP